MLIFAVNTLFFSFLTRFGENWEWVLRWVWVKDFSVGFLIVH